MKPLRAKLGFRTSELKFFSASSLHILNSGSIAERAARITSSRTTPYSASDKSTSCDTIFYMNFPSLDTALQKNRLQFFLLGDLPVNNGRNRTGLDTLFYSQVLLCLSRLLGCRSSSRRCRSCQLIFGRDGRWQMGVGFGLGCELQPVVRHVCECSRVQVRLPELRVDGGQRCCYDRSCLGGETVIPSTSEMTLPPATVVSAGRGFKCWGTAKLDRLLRPSWNPALAPHTMTSLPKAK